MRTASHLEKIGRLVSLRRRLRALQDFELWYWTTLTASTNALNASYHLCNLTAPDPVFSTVPGVHLVQQTDGSYARELRGPGDVSHLNWPPVEGARPETLRAMEFAIATIESHRDPCLRGDRRPTPEIVQELEASFELVQKMLESIVQETTHDT